MTWLARRESSSTSSAPTPTPKRNEISQELSTLLTDHGNTIAMNPVLFGRISELASRADELDLTEPQRRLLDKRYRESVRAGAGLPAAEQEEMRQIASRLAYLTTTFSQKILDDTNESAVLVDDAADLDGLSAGQITAARRAAADAGHESGYLLTLELPTSQSVLTELTNPPAVRQRVFDASMNRCSRGNDHDTRDLVLEIVRLRARRAELLGYRDHAEFVIAEQTAPDPSAVDDLLRELNESAMRAGGRELTRLTEFAGDVEIGPADLTFWLEREKQARSSVPLDGFADYCELDIVLTRGASSTPRTSCTACSSSNGPACPSITPTCACGRCGTTPAPASACSSVTSTRGRRSAAVPG